MVQGGGFDRQAMMAYYFARVESLLGGCTMFAIGDRPITGRNYDWAVKDLHWCELRRYGIRRIGYTHHWAGCCDVLTEKGLYVAIASLPPADVRAPGLQWNTVVDMIAQRCSSVPEAAEACAAVRHLRSVSYLVADGRGAKGVIEATPEGVRLRTGHDIVVAANAPLGGRLIRDWSRERPPYVLPKPICLAPENYRNDAVARATRRIGRVRELLAASGPQVSEGDVKRVLSDHGAPICTGDHARPDGAPWATIWSLVCLPAERRFCIAPGLPCRHAYQPFALQPIPPVAPG